MSSNITTTNFLNGRELWNETKYEKKIYNFFVLCCAHKMSFPFCVTLNLNSLPLAILSSDLFIFFIPFLLVHHMIHFVSFIIYCLILQTIFHRFFFLFLFCWLPFNTVVFFIPIKRFIIRMNRNQFADRKDDNIYV